MATDRPTESLDYTFSLVTQNKYKFYSLTVPSDVLGDTCFVTTRFDDPEDGFQRRLDRKRAQEIADYIDSHAGTIPNAVILSAQTEAQFEVKKGGRAVKFIRHPKAFLVLDGQHRIWGYKLAKSNLRVPVIIYRDLSRAEETRLFIDINTKQKPVPSELLLDIKHLADLENTFESLTRELFDLFNSAADSNLAGLLSPTEKAKGKLTRTSFNSAFSSIQEIMRGKPSDELYHIFNAYIGAFESKLSKINADRLLTEPNVFKAVVSFFPDVASKVKDRFDGVYNIDNFGYALMPIVDKLSISRLKSKKTSYKSIAAEFSNALKQEFTL